MFFLYCVHFFYHIDNIKHPQLLFLELVKVYSVKKRLMYFNRFFIDRVWLKLKLNNYYYCRLKYMRNYYIQLWKTNPTWSPRKARPPKPNLVPIVFLPSFFLFSHYLCRLLYFITRRESSVFPILGVFRGRRKAEYGKRTEFRENTFGTRISLFI